MSSNDVSFKRNFVLKGKINEKVLKGDYKVQAIIEALKKSCNSFTKEGYPIVLEEKKESFVSECAKGSEYWSQWKRYRYEHLLYYAYDYRFRDDYRIVLKFPFGDVKVTTSAGDVLNNIDVYNVIVMDVSGMNGQCDMDDFENFVDVFTDFLTL